MRNLLSKATVGAMIAGAALTVAACSSETTTNTTNVTDLGNTTMDANAMDMGMDANMTMDMNAMPPADMNMAPPADANMANGM